MRKSDSIDKVHGNPAETESTNKNMRSIFDSLDGFHRITKDLWKEEVVFQMFKEHFKILLD